MLDFISWYFTSLVDFWSSVLRIGVPHILLLVLLFFWLRRRRCGKSRAKSCCWTWDGGDGAGSWCCRGARCCREAEGEEDGVEEGAEDGHGEGHNGS